jgi:uncharacterized protein (TIGR00255 family)
MIQSMTGFASKVADIAPFGKISVELRSSNHKFLEIVFHLPEGLLSLEDKIKREIEARVKRGRVTCAITISGAKASTVFINKALLKNYISTLKGIQRQFNIDDEIGINTLIHLPGVLSLEEGIKPKVNIWPSLKALISQAVADLVKMRQKEGRALFRFLKIREEQLRLGLAFIKLRFKKAIKEKLQDMQTDEERAGFLKDTDITEEIDRLAFHIRNFKSKLSKTGPIGKELDFIAQEMQREANTLGAKTFDVTISGRVVQIKSQIEKIREQVQNIE